MALALRAVLQNCLVSDVRKFEVFFLFHVGDSCCNPLSLGRLMDVIKTEVPGIYVRSLQIGSDFEQDTLNGFFMNVNDQITEACTNLSADANLQNGFNVMGFSQGGQFL